MSFPEIPTQNSCWLQQVVWSAWRRVCSLGLAQTLTLMSHWFVGDFKQAERKDCHNQEGALATLFLPFLFLSLSLLLLLSLWPGTCCPFFWVATTWLQSPGLWVIAIKLLAFNWPPLCSSRVPCPCYRDGCCLWSRWWFANYKIAIILCILDYITLN